MSSILLFVILSMTFIHVYSWGPIGHRIVARLAQSELTETTLDWIQYLIPWHWNGNLTAMAIWADDILYSNTNPTGFDNWQWSRPLHYINIADWSCNYLIERDCINDFCVDGAIRNYTKRLESELDDIQHQEALYFLIHFVGDIHQPLHTGFLSDRGGNHVRGHFMNSSTVTNLHSLWDHGILDYRIKNNFHSNINLYYDYIYKIMINQSITNNDNDIQQWVKESLNIVCRQVYFDDKYNKMNSSIRFHLNETYYNRSFPIIEQRLAQGGRRLGALLNRLSQNGPTKLTKNKLCPGTYILIAVLSFEFIFGIFLGIFFFIRYQIKH